MADTQHSSTLQAAAASLRALILAAEDGALLGSEEDLQEKLGVSRATVRQIARLLEREGLLSVRRGLRGGYYAARPSLDTIETAVSAYLEVLHVPPEDLTIIAAALWAEVVRKAAGLRSPEALAMAERFSAELRRLPDDAGFDAVFALEKAIRDTIFALIESRYVELIFQINVAFAQRKFPHPPSLHDGTPAHRAFVRGWRASKLLELEAIASGDSELGVMAARHVRKLWHDRMWGVAD